MTQMTDQKCSHIVSKNAGFLANCESSYFLSTHTRKHELGKLSPQMELLAALNLPPQNEQAKGHLNPAARTAPLQAITGLLLCHA